MSRDTVFSSSRLSSKCNCQVPLAVVKSWTRENPGRRFLTCKFYNPGIKFCGCEFFRWYDQNQCDWQRDVINELVLDKKLLCKEMEIIKAENSHLEEQNKRLKEEIELLMVKSKLDGNDTNVEVVETSPKNEWPTTLYVVLFVCIMTLIVKVLV
ncbi:hypothetical protein RND81_07G122100 [Saponaria officinalis]|uniref:GRF-type domain-containing protein n=1 Tax=Saponaria officinalis TaxID=3572 RepID=A0AAW1JTG2_SAPOF